MPLISVLGMQRQTDLCEFKASPGLHSEFQSELPTSSLKQKGKETNPNLTSVVQ
jgi:hypothetical protein